MSKPHVAILGGGPAGCGAAYKLLAEERATVTLLERNARYGGNAGSFELKGQWVDFGSHRLHFACDPGVLADIKRLLGEDLRLRDRHGRIRLRERWLHFPLQTVDLLLRLDRMFALGILRDMSVGKVLRNGAGPDESFASVLRANLGPTISEGFYFPYARKMWGREPEELSAIQARKRVSAGTIAKILRRLVKPPGGGQFWYPRRGYGQITEAYARAAEDLGARMLTETAVSSLGRPDRTGGRWTVVASRDGVEENVEVDHVWSTIPVTLAVQMMDPPPPPEVLEAGRSMEYRAMVLVYLGLEVDRFTGTDAHYFPEEHVRMTRLSEPKNYFGAEEPRGSTILCAELPCSTEDDVWTMSNEELADLVTGDMERAGLPAPGSPSLVHVKRLRQAYPIYPVGYEKHLETLDRWMESLPGFLSYGRQGLFAHDNTHHALYMAYAAVDSLGDGGIDRARWQEYRKVFATHVVED